MRLANAPLAAGPLAALGNLPQGNTILKVRCGLLLGVSIQVWGSFNLSLLQLFS
jgi:hypothetical protein